MKQTGKPMRSAGVSPNSRTALTAILLLLASSAASAQCVEGDCRDGRGKFDFGWSTYAGEFAEGKPHGYGVLDYGDYRYEGSFRSGSEHGRGTLFYPDGSTKEVRYDRGNLVRPPRRAEAFSEAEGLGCISGDCENGRGREVAPSGAVYDGDFHNGRRNGMGTLDTPFGDRYEGEFADGRPHGKGTFRWASGYSFTGTFVDGVETEGVYTNPEGATVRLENGELVKAPSASARTQTITFKIVGDQLIVDSINGIDADGRKRLVLYSVGHVTRELNWTEIPVAYLLTVYEVDAPYDMDLQTIRQKIYEQVEYRSRDSYGYIKKAGYPMLHVAPGTHSYDAKSYLAGKYGSEVWTKAENLRFRLDW